MLHLLSVRMTKNVSFINPVEKYVFISLTFSAFQIKNGILFWQLWQSKPASYLGETTAEPLLCSGGWEREESPSTMEPSTLLSSRSSDVLLSPKSSKCSSSPLMTVTKEWLWSSEFRENLGRRQCIN